MREVPILRATGRWFRQKAQRTEKFKEPRQKFKEPRQKVTGQREPKVSTQFSSHYSHPLTSLWRQL